MCHCRKRISTVLLLSVCVQAAKRFFVHIPIRLEQKWRKLNPAEAHKKGFKYDITRALTELSLSRAQLTAMLKLFIEQCTSEDEYLEQMTGHINRGTVHQIKFIKKCKLARAKLLGIDVRAKLSGPDGGFSAAAASSGGACGDPPGDADDDDDDDPEDGSLDEADTSRDEDEEAEDVSVAPEKRKLGSGTRGGRRKRSRRYASTAPGLAQVLFVLYL